jgi:hypothetical protein
MSADDAWKYPSWYFVICKSLPSFLPFTCFHRVLLHSSTEVMRGSHKKTRQRRQGLGQNESTDDSGLVLSAPSAERIPGVIKTLTKEKRLWRKVLAHNGTISTSVGGFVIGQSLTGSNAVTACSNWTDASALALEYRVLGIECEFFPYVNDQTTYTTPAPAYIALCAYSSGVALTTMDLILEGPQGKVVDGRKPFKFSVSTKGFMDGLSWFATNASITTSNTYGVCLIGASGIAGPASTIVYVWTVKYLTEFRSLF